MKNVSGLFLALVCYATVGEFVAGLASASELAPGSPVSQTQMEFSAKILLAKKASSPRRTTAAFTVNGVRHHDHKKYIRVVLDLNGEVSIKESKNQRTQTATISLSNIQLSKRARQQIKRKNFPRAIAIRSGDSQTVSIVLDLKALRTYRLLTLRQPDRVAVDLFYAKGRPRVAAKSKSPPSIKSKNVSSGRKTPTVAKSKAKTNQPSRTVRRSNPRSAPQNIPSLKIQKDVLVVIDPGHGGKDPGTIGRKGTREKTITLQVSKTLRRLIERRLKLKVLLTRSRDTFLDLEDRVDFANREKADLFISVHVNSHAKQSIQGVEIYHFGKASDPRALEVAARENGMKLESDAPPWQVIIADKLDERKINASQTFAWTTGSMLITTLQKKYRIKDHGVKTAPFYVLRFTTMPSILIEMGFMSNPMEETRLQNTTFQKELAEGIYQGIQSYLKELRPTPF